MLETSARLLRLLQTPREWTGAEPAERLAVSTRTVRNHPAHPCTRLRTFTCAGRSRLSVTDLQRSPKGASTARRGERLGDQPR